MKKVSIILVIVLVSLFGKQKETTLLYPPFGHTWGIHRGTEGKLDMILGNVTDFDNPQGLAAVKLKSWDDPDNSDDDDEITCFGVNANRGQIIYNTSMSSLGIYGEIGDGVGQFRQPRGICATSDGDVYVADMGNNRIVHLRMPKKELKWVKSIGDTFLIAPFDVTVVPGGTLYVSDAERNSIVVMDTSGSVLDEWEGFYFPRGIDADASSMRWSGAKQNIVVVVDSAGKKISLLDRVDGYLRESVNMADLGMPNADMQYIAFDYLDNIYAVDSMRCQVHKFDRKLNYIVSVGKCGTKDEQFEYPRGIAIWRRFGQIVISERTGAQYFWVGVDVKNLDISLDNQNRELILDFFLTESAYLTVHLKGKDVDSRIYRRRVAIGKREINIQLPENIPSGKYELLITIEATYSSYKHFILEFNKKIKL